RWGAGLMDLSAIFIDQIPIVSCDLRVKSLSFVPMPMIPNSPVDITIVIENVGIAVVEDFCVDWERWYFGPNAFPTKHFPIGGGPERNAQGLLMPGNTRTFQRSWTPGVSDNLPFDGTSCFWGRVIALCDTNVSNNQRTVNTHLDSLTIGGRSASGGTGGDISEVEFRLGHDRFGVVNMQVTLLNPDPSNWLAELDIEGQVGQTLVIPVDNQECAVWGFLRTTRLTPTAASVEITVSASDGAGAPLGDMTIFVVSGDATVACCFSGDFCAELTRADCANAGGVPDDQAADCNRSSGACTPQRCSDPGDMNGDGLFNGEDLQEFIDCLLSAVPNCICADVNLDGMLDDGDVPEMVDRMLIATACP
ncbi:MAG: hypothetical protein O7G85_16175, partial [Planctomycetota bacterium]|nr:hypothetical protein [Planctomycetota bacterium]